MIIWEVCPIYPRFYVVSYLFIYLFISLQGIRVILQKNPDINNALHTFYGTQNFKELIQVIP
jgi:hypothetical protein